MIFTKYFYSATEEKEGRALVQREKGRCHQPQGEEGERRKVRGGRGGVG